MYQLPSFTMSPTNHRESTATSQPSPPPLYAKAQRQPDIQEILRFSSVGAQPSDEDVVVRVLRHPSLDKPSSPLKRVLTITPNSPSPPPPELSEKLPNAIDVSDLPSPPKNIIFKRPHLFTRQSSTIVVSPLPPAPTVAIPEPIAESVTTLPESESPETSKSHWWQFGRKQTASIDKPVVAVTAADTPAIILPTHPTDEEKFLYATTRR